MRGAATGVLGARAYSSSELFEDFSSKRSANLNHSVGTIKVVICTIKRLRVVHIESFWNNHHIVADVIDEGFMNFDPF